MRKRLWISHGNQKFLGQEETAEKGEEEGPSFIILYTLAASTSKQEHPRRASTQGQKKHPLLQYLCTALKGPGGRAKSPGGRSKGKEHGPRCLLLYLTFISFGKGGKGGTATRRRVKSEDGGML